MKKYLLKKNEILIIISSMRSKTHDMKTFPVDQ